MEYRTLYSVTVLSCVGINSRGNKVIPRLSYDVSLLVLISTINFMFVPFPGIRARFTFT